MSILFPWWEQYINILRVQNIYSGMYDFIKLLLKKNKPETLTMHSNCVYMADQ